MTTEERIAIVRRSIELIKMAETRDHDSMMDVTADADDRDAARAALSAAMRDFSGQWANVEIILDALQKDEIFALRTEEPQPVVAACDAVEEWE